MIPARDILQVVARYHDVELCDLVNPGLTRSHVHARQEACWIMRSRTRLTFGQIGHMLGGRDHTAIIAATRAVENRRQKDRAYRRQTDFLLHLVDLDAEKHNRDRSPLTIDAPVVALVAEVLRIQRGDPVRDLNLALRAIITAVKNLNGGSHAIQ